MATYSTAQYRAILVRQGVKWLNSKDRYIKNGNQVQDLAAGLTWRNCNEPCATGNTQGEYYSPAKAFKQAQKVAKETGEKWRVPSIKEILSIQTFGDNPLLDVNVFNIGGKMQNGDFTYITNTPSFDNSNVKYYASDILIDDNKGKTAYPIHAGKYKLTLVK